MRVSTETDVDARGRGRGRGAALVALVLLALGAMAGPAAAKPKVKKVAPPQTVIQTGPAPRIASRSTTFTYTGTARRRIRILRFSWKLDRGRWSKFTRATAHTFTGLKPGRHVFRVRAQDGARRTDRSPALGVFVVDLTPPVVTISGPPNPTPSATNLFSFRANEPGAVFECSHDGTPFATCRPPVRISVSKNGWHNLLVRATDVAGNVGTAARRPWKVNDVTPPAAPIINGPQNGSARSVEFTLRDAEAGVRFRCTLDATLTRFCTTPLAYNNLAIATHKLVVTAVDAVGNESAPSEWNWSVANFDPPDTSILQKPLAQATTNNATFTFTQSGAHSAVTYECALDTAAFAPCTSPQSFTGLANGPHTFQVRAKDIWLNVDPTPASYTWTVTIAASYKLLIADNEGKRLWITDFNGNPVWRCLDPLGDSLTYSGPLSVRWLPNNHILASFGTGVVGEIDPSKPCPNFPGQPNYNAANNPFVWKYNGPAGDGFQSPYDADVLPDGTLAVALRFNVISGSPKGKVAVYDRKKTGADAIVWQRPVPEAHTVTYFPAGTGYQTSLPELLVGGFGSDTADTTDGLEEVTYVPNPTHDPNSPQVVTWHGPSEFTHRAIVDSGDNIVASEGYYLHKIGRDGHEFWRIKLTRPAPSTQHIEWRGIAEDPTNGGYIAAEFTDSQIWFLDANGNVLKKWGIYKLTDGSPYNYMRFPYGLRVINYNP
jgi:hypothetical protein